MMISGVKRCALNADCTLQFNITKKMPGPFNVYLQLDNFHHSFKKFINSFPRKFFVDVSNLRVKKRQKKSENLQWCFWRLLENWRGKRYAQFGLRGFGSVISERFILRDRRLRQKSVPCFIRKCGRSKFSEIIWVKTWTGRIAKSFICELDLDWVLLFF